MPLALRGSDLYLTAGLWLVKVLELHGRSDLTFEIADDLLRYQNEDIGKFKAIYIGGGNTWNLIRELKDSYFDDKLSKYLELGGIIYGGSAGAIILGKRIDTHDDENKISYTDTSGLNFLNHFSVACHYREEQSGLNIIIPQLFVSKKKPV
jgi:dipeptidase E